MQLVVNPLTGSLRLDGKEVVFDTHYPVDDNHRVIFRGSSSSPVIQLKEGRRVIRTAGVPQVSAVAGRNANGEPTRQVFEIAITTDPVSYTHLTLPTIYSV